MSFAFLFSPGLTVDTPILCPLWLSRCLLSTVLFTFCSLRFNTYLIVFEFKFVDRRESRDRPKVFKIGEKKNFTLNGSRMLLAMIPPSEMLIPSEWISFGARESNYYSIACFPFSLPTLSVSLSLKDGLTLLCLHQVLLSGFSAASPPYAIYRHTVDFFSPKSTRARKVNSRRGPWRIRSLPFTRLQRIRLVLFKAARERRDYVYIYPEKSKKKRGRGGGKRKKEKQRIYNKNLEERRTQLSRIEWQWISGEKEKEREREREREREKEKEIGGQRDDKRRLRAFAAVLEPRLISPITPYSAATHDPPTSAPPAPPMSTSPRLVPARAATHPPPILLGATMERLTRSNPRHSRLLLSCARARARFYPFSTRSALSPLSIAYIPLRWTKCVSPVAVYTASTTVSPFPSPSAASHYPPRSPPRRSWSSPRPTSSSNLEHGPQPLM